MYGLYRDKGTEDRGYHLGFRVWGLGVFPAGHSPKENLQENFSLREKLCGKKP